MSFLDSRPQDLDDSTRGKPNRRRRVILAWTVVALWAALIWTLGGDSFSATQTSSTFADILRWLGIEFSPAQRYRAIQVIRKCAHFVEYAILAVLTFRAAWISAGRSQITAAAWLALFFVATLATADEARQAFSTSRTGSPYDVLIDITGGTIAIVALLYLGRRFQNQSESQSET